MHLLSYIHPVDDFFLVDRKWPLLEFLKDGQTIHWYKSNICFQDIELYRSQYRVEIEIIELKISGIQYQKRSIEIEQIKLIGY